MALTTASVAGSTLSMQAQGTEELASAKVPFSFRLGKQLYPAGSYHFRLSGENVLFLRSDDSSGFAMVRLEQTSSARRLRQGVLVFRHEAEYELNEIQAPRHGLSLQCALAGRGRQPSAEHGKGEQAGASGVVTLALTESGR